MTDLFTPFDSRLDQVIDEVALEIAGGSLVSVRARGVISGVD
ncbi:hypothetical protein [Erythrobacter colymbi]|nr:hypothetical protein [Erythrobacter colymbi]